MNFEQERTRMVRALTAITDPTDRAKAAGTVLEQLPQLTAQVHEIRRLAALELRAQGLSYAQVGERLGITRARVQQITAKPKGEAGQAPSRTAT